MKPQTIVERLDFVAKRIPGLKLLQLSQVKPGDEHSCIMGCDTYYIEIKFDPTLQCVKDVIITHEANTDFANHCQVLRKVLSDQDYETFAKHLSGLHSIYQISSSDKKVRQKAYPTLTALETDLTILYDHQRRRTNNCHDLVHKSPIGIMEPRKGGFPVKLTYFITPYDMVDTNQKGFINLTINNIIDKNLGLSATVEIEGSTPHKLQVSSLISTQHNTSLPAYAPFNSQNSEKLPAQFVLKLSQPIPMLNTSINQIINEINEPTTIKEYLTKITLSGKESLINLIARQELDLNKGPFGRSVESIKGLIDDTCDLKKQVYTIKLLDQQHTYHILDHCLERQDGFYVTKIPFTHPTSIPIILRVLRQQALFNFVIGSCIRRNNKSSCNGNSVQENTTSKINGHTNVFDVVPVNLNSICVSFEHPSKESLATLEIDVKELSCQLYALDKESVCSNEFATKVLQKCWSIPITLRSVLKKCDERRLALLEDANKRRERELQELLTNNTTNEQGLEYNSHHPYQETTHLQSKFNSLNKKSNQRDLNSIAEFLSSKINNASTSDASNQATSNQTDSATNRSNLLKKFSCKPKAKQNPATKNNPTGNKILSLMLKRQNSTSSLSEDANLKATLVKKVKTKNTSGAPESSAKNPSGGISTTKLISPEAAIAARSASKQAKQGGNINQNAAAQSLIRSPNKSQVSLISSSSTPAGGGGQSVQGTATSSKLPDASLLSSTNPNNLSARLKTAQFNGSTNCIINNSNSTNAIGNAMKPRKSSINAVLDCLVGGLAPTDANNLSQSNNASQDSELAKNCPLGTKSKSRSQADQFAIKQGSLGGLKLTVTKTKPAVTPTSSNPNPTAAILQSSSTSTSSATSANNTSSKTETSKILGLGSSTPNIKYTIPKISKTQQASQSSFSQANSTDNQNSTQNDSTISSDDSNNPSSTANSSTAPSSTTTNKRATPFSRPNNSNRNSVSSSTHPLGRTTSNPLAGASRPSSTSSNESHVPNRISSSNQSQQNMRQQIGNRIINLQQQQQQQQQLQLQQQQSLQPGAQRMLNPTLNINMQAQQVAPQAPPIFALGSSIQQSSPFVNAAAVSQAVNLLNKQRNLNPLQQQQVPGPFMSSSVDANLISSSKPQFAAALTQQLANPSNSMNNAISNVGDSLQRPSPSILNGPPQFYVRQPMFEDVAAAAAAAAAAASSANTVSSTPRIPNEASQSSLIPVASFLPRDESQFGQVNQMSSSSSSLTGNQPATVGGNQGVSSSSDSGNNNEPTFSTPSSPTECSQVETVAPPPLIPIDSLEEPQAASPEADHPDDASDRLSIVDMNENIADCNSAAGTPKPSGVNSPLNTQDSNSATPSSSSRAPEQAAAGSSVNSTSAAGLPSSLANVSGSTPMEVDAIPSGSSTEPPLAVRPVGEDTMQSSPPKAPTSSGSTNNNATTSSSSGEISALQAQSSSSSSTWTPAAAMGQPLELAQRRPAQPTSSIASGDETLAPQPSVAATTSDMA